MNPQELISAVLVTRPDKYSTPTEVLTEVLTRNTDDFEWTPEGEIKFNCEVSNISDKIDELYARFKEIISNPSSNSDRKNYTLFIYTNALKVLLNIDCIMESPLTYEDITHYYSISQIVNIEDNSLIVNIPNNVTPEWATAINVYITNVIEPVKSKMDEESLELTEDIDTTRLNRSIRNSQYNGEALF